MAHDLSPEGIGILQSGLAVNDRILVGITTGGQTVYVCRQHPGGLTERERAVLFMHDPEARRWSWEMRRRDPVVYVRGRISHPDHKTVLLRGWHRVHMNTEHRSVAMRHVAFLD